jgi:hypothetical protein
LLKVLRRGHLPIKIIKAKYKNKLFGKRKFKIKHEWGGRRIDATIRKFADPLTIPSGVAEVLLRPEAIWTAHVCDEGSSTTRSR